MFVCVSMPLTTPPYAYSRPYICPHTHTQTEEELRTIAKAGMRMGTDEDAYDDLIDAEMTNAR